MKILIVGAAGFIGHRVAYFLQHWGHDVYGCDNYDDYLARNVHPIIGREGMERLWHERIFPLKHIPIKLDITDIRAVYDFVEQVEPEILIFTAGVSSNERFRSYPEIYIPGMTTGLLNVLKAFRQIVSHRGKFVYISDADTRKSGYMSYKLAGEEIIRDFGNCQFMMLRPSQVYGPCSVGFDRISELIDAASRNQILYSCENSFADYIYIDDCAIGIAHMALDNTSVDRVFNIISNTSINGTNLSIIIRNMIGGGFISNGVAAPTDYLPLDIPNALDTGFKPAYSIEAGIKETWEWIKQRSNSN